MPVWVVVVVVCAAGGGGTAETVVWRVVVVVVSGVLEQEASINPKAARAVANIIPFFIALVLIYKPIRHNVHQQMY